LKHKYENNENNEQKVKQMRLNYKTSLVIIVSSAITVNSNKVMISISKYESPPTRWITNGYIMVGVTDTICNIKTDVWKQSKQAAGKTYSETKAIDILQELTVKGYNNIEDPYSYTGSNEFIQATVMYKYYYCKVLVRNVSKNRMNSFEYEEYLNEVYSSVNNYGFNPQYSSSYPDKKKDGIDKELITVLVCASVIGLVVCVLIFRARERRADERREDQRRASADLNL